MPDQNSSNGQADKIMVIMPDGKVAEAGMDTGKSLQIIRATVPETELYKYSTSLRSITQGRGDFTAEFPHCEEVPYEIAQKIIAESRKVKVERQKECPKKQRAPRAAGPVHQPQLGPAVRFTIASAHSRATIKP